MKIKQYLLFFPLCVCGSFQLLFLGLKGVGGLWLAPSVIRRAFFSFKADAEVRGLRLFVCEAAPLAERIHDKMSAPAAAPLAFIVAENGGEARLVGLCENAWPGGGGFCERRFRGRRVTFSAVQAEESFACFFEAVVDGLGADKRGLAAPRAMDFHGFHCE